MYNPAAKTALPRGPLEQKPEILLDKKSELVDLCRMHEKVTREQQGGYIPADGNYTITDMNFYRYDADFTNLKYVVTMLRVVLMLEGSDGSTRLFATETDALQEGTMDSMREHIVGTTISFRNGEIVDEVMRQFLRGYRPARSYKIGLY